MSAILKALKKLEQESTANAGASLPGSIKGRPKRRPGSLVVPGLIAFTLCIFTGVGVLIFTQNISVPESPTALLRDKKPAAAIKTSAEITPGKRATGVDNQKQTKPADDVTGFEFSTTGGFRDNNRQAESGNQIQESFNTQKQGMTAAPVNFFHTADPFSPIMSTQINPTLRKLTPDAEDENTSPILENAKPAVPYQSEISISEMPIPAIPDNTIVSKPVIRKAEPSVEILDDPSIDLQAISWSGDADKRMAIINGKICRENDHVAGYVVQSINSGDVVISKGSVKGKLVFKIR